MKITTIILFSFFVLTGCGTTLTVPLDTSLMNQEKATIIIFHEQGFTDEFKVFLNREPVGVVTSEMPLKLSVIPGVHELHTEVTAVIDRVTKKTFEPGKVYFMKIWLDMGMWVSSIRIDPTYERETYNVISHRMDKWEYVDNQVDSDMPPLTP